MSSAQWLESRGIPRPIRIFVLAPIIVVIMGLLYVFVFLPVWILSRLGKPLQRRHTRR